MRELNKTACPRCGSQKLKTWKDLSDDERILVGKLPQSAEFSSEERRRHSWCARCWHEYDSSNEMSV